jgi:glucose/arabinose dehydrogenase
VTAFGCRRRVTAFGPRRRVTAFAFAAALVFAGCERSPATPPPPIGDLEIRLEQVAAGLAAPVHLAAAPGDTRVFIVEQPGRVRVVEDGQLLATPFLDITAQVRSGGEQGLLSVAFHPQYASNGHFFVNYTDLAGTTRVERFTVSADANRADPGSGKLILEAAQPFGNHNGGHILFGPDGMLYIAMGDGGSGGDPHGHGQDRGTLLGALLRIDVDGGDPYRVPQDNPFVSEPGARGEIWAIGLRNPWRIAFDAPGGHIYVADVGQNRREEVNVQPMASAGLNYGWNVMEGSLCFPTGSACDASGLVLPALEYANPADGCSVTGGHVYRGSAIAELQGHYFYADHCRGWVRSFRFSNSGSVTDQTEWPFGDIGRITSFGEDAAGELYIVSHGGRIYRIVRQD